MTDRHQLLCSDCAAAQRSLVTKPVSRSSVTNANSITNTLSSAQVIGGCVQTMFFFGSLVPTFFLDRLGRRKPMMWGSLGLALSMMLISILLSFNTDRGYSDAIQKSTSSASVAFFFTYMFIFGASANCIPWVYVPEILPLHVRAKGSSVGISANWLWNFVSFTFLRGLPKN